MFWGLNAEKKVERLYIGVCFSKFPFLTEHKRRLARRRACPLTLVLTKLPGEWVRAATEGLCETLGSSLAVLGHESSSGEEN